MARPTKYTAETVRKVVEGVRLGATYELACAYAGITYETFNQWRKTKPAFSEAVKAAEGRAAVVWLGRIEEAAQDGRWQAAAWKLERRYPDAYGRARTGHPHQDLDDAKRNEIIAEVAAKYGVPEDDLRRAMGEDRVLEQRPG